MQVDIKKWAQEEGMRKYPEITFWIEHEFKSLVQDKLTPWSFLNAGKMAPVKDFHGRTICYVGVEFEGSPRKIFWNGFIEPFIEALFPKAFDSGFTYAAKCNIAPEPVIQHVHHCLANGIHGIYTKMQDIDRQLRGKGFPDRIPAHDIAS